MTGCIYSWIALISRCICSASVIVWSPSEPVFGVMSETWIVLTNKLNVVASPGRASLIRPRFGTGRYRQREVSRLYPDPDARSSFLFIIRWAIP